MRAAKDSGGLHRGEEDAVITRVTALERAVHFAGGWQLGLHQDHNLEAPG